MAEARGTQQGAPMVPFSGHQDVGGPGGVGHHVGRQGLATVAVKLRPRFCRHLAYVLVQKASDEDPPSHLPAKQRAGQGACICVRGEMSDLTGFELPATERANAEYKKPALASSMPPSSGILRRRCVHVRRVEGLRPPDREART